MGSMSSPLPSSDPIDAYELVSEDAAMWLTLYLPMHYTRRSRKAPSGLVLMPWSAGTERPKLWWTLGGHGVTSRVDDFPFGLPDAVAASESHNHLGPGMGTYAADKIREVLDSQPGRWSRPADFPRDAWWA